MFLFREVKKKKLKTIFEDIFVWWKRYFPIRKDERKRKQWKRQTSLKNRIWWRNPLFFIIHPFSRMEVIRKGSLFKQKMWSNSGAISDLLGDQLKNVSYHYSFFFSKAKTKKVWSKLEYPFEFGDVFDY